MRSRLRKIAGHGGLAWLALSALAPAGAWATYSIVAVDRATRQVGGAVTSCVAPNTVAGVYGSAPGRGAVASQAASNRAGRDRAVELLMTDVAPDQIITTLTSPAFDRGAASRQYGVVDMMGRAAGHSGATNGVFSNDVQGDFEGFTYSIQGNILTGAAVLTQAQTAFRGQACDLADRLMRALEAGAANGQGDRRCTPAGAPSDSAFIQVDLPGQPVGSYLRLSVVAPRRTNPLTGLRAQFDVWRRTHPCPDATPNPPPPAQPADAGTDSGGAPSPADAGGGPRLDAGGAGPRLDGGGSNPRPVDSGAPGGQTDAGGSGGAGGSSGAGGAGGSPGNIPPGAGGGAPGNPAPGGPAPAAGTPGGGAPPAGAGTPPPQTPAAMPTGCDCRISRGTDANALGLLVAAAWLIARRRRR
jgi:uncharacterized Ntn-hydrolase superfamily protein